MTEEDFAKAEADFVKENAALLDEVTQVAPEEMESQSACSCRRSAREPALGSRPKAMSEAPSRRSRGSSPRTAPAVSREAASRRRAEGCAGTLLSALSPFHAAS